jgi:hypothetical protein
VGGGGGVLGVGGEAGGADVVLQAEELPAGVAHLDAALADVE